jgi:formylglycine-generating enzyme required for sulfatase activity
MILAFLLLISPAFAGTEGVYSGLVGAGSIGSGSVQDQNDFFAGNGFVSLSSGSLATRGGPADAYTGALRLEGRTHLFSGTWNAGSSLFSFSKSGALWSGSLTHSGTEPGVVDGTLSGGGGTFSFSLPRVDLGAKGGSHALGGKRYSILLPPPEGERMGFGVATLYIAYDGLASLSGWLPNGQSFSCFAMMVEEGQGKWTMPVYLASTSLLTGKVVVAMAAPLNASEVQGRLMWRRPASGTAAGFLKELFPVGAFHSSLDSAAVPFGLAGGAFTLNLKSAAGGLSTSVAQAGNWPADGKPVLSKPVKNGLTMAASAAYGQFDGVFTDGAAGGKRSAYKGVLLSRTVQLRDGTQVRGGGFYTMQDVVGPVLVTSNVASLSRSKTTAMVVVAGGVHSADSAFKGQSVDGFKIGKYEVTWGEWKVVRDWAGLNGYRDLAGAGAGTGDNYPVHSVSWYDVVKWCNAKSQKEGLTPVYEVSGGLHEPYKNGQLVPVVNGAANGYRLPTEMEWEWAARGGAQTQRYTYSGSSDSAAVGWTVENSFGSSKEVGTKQANELGLFDMSGNLWEWNWDVAPMSGRRLRGGCWNGSVKTSGVADRSNFYYSPGNRDSTNGFRIACKL